MITKNIQHFLFSLYLSSKLKRKYLDDEISRTIMFVQPHPSSNDRNQFTSIIDAYPKDT
jgi:hypothetical protein